MKVSRRSNYVLLAGASALALSMAAPAAIAQDQDEEARTLGTVVVTTQKTEESIQDVPIAVSAFDEEMLESMQLAGGPDLVKAIPNVNFTKGNFGGFNFRIRGIGVDAVTTSADAGVGIHMNDVPLFTNSFFEAEFYDVERVESLRGPQGTLYGRNATGGVVNVITAKPVLEEFQADGQLTYGNHNTVKAKGMLNLPIGEKAALRLAGSYLSRDGYVTNLTTGNDVDSRDLYALRASFAFEPTDRFRGLLIAEHFNEDDSRLRSGKQLCDQDPTKTTFNNIAISAVDQLITSQGCVDNSLSAPESLEGLNNASTLGAQYGFLAGLIGGVDPLTGNAINLNANTDGIPADLRVIEALFDPTFETEQTLLTWKGEFDLTDSLTVTYLGSYNERTNISQEDYNEQSSEVPFNTTPGPFSAFHPIGGAGVAALYPILLFQALIRKPQRTNCVSSRTLMGHSTSTWARSRLMVRPTRDQRFKRAIMCSSTRRRLSTRCPMRRLSASVDLLCSRLRISPMLAQPRSKTWMAFPASTSARSRRISSTVSRCLVKAISTSTTI